MRRLLPLLLAFSVTTGFAEDENAVPLKPFRVEQVRPTYKVTEGDTVHSIARKFGRDPKLLLWLNRLDEAAVLSVGKVIFIGDSPIVSR